MPGYLSQIALSANPRAGLVAPRLRPAIRSLSPIAEFDQRIGLDGWDAPAPVIGEPGPAPAPEPASGEPPSPGPRLSQPAPPPVALPRAETEISTPAQEQRPPKHPLSPNRPAAARAVSEYSSPMMPGTAAPIEPPRGAGDENPVAKNETPDVPMARPETKPVSPTRPSPRPRASQLRAEAERPARATPPEHPEPLQRLPNDSKSQESVTEAAPPRRFSHLPVFAAESAPVRESMPPATRHRQTAAAPRTRPQEPSIAMPPAAKKQAPGPRVVIDRLEIEIVPPAPPPPATARHDRRRSVPTRPGANRSVSKIGPLSDAMAASRALSLRYR